MLSDILIDPSEHNKKDLAKASSANSGSTAPPNSVISYDPNTLEAKIILVSNRHIFRISDDTVHIFSSMYVSTQKTREHLTTSPQGQLSYTFKIGLVDFMILYYLIKTIAPMLQKWNKKQNPPFLNQVRKHSVKMNNHALALIHK